MKSSFPDLLKRLDDCQVDHILVGGMAANLHGSPITTMDCDIVVSLDSDNLSKLARALSPLSPTFRHKDPPQTFNEEVAARDG